jgi:hypothetical protein
MSISYDSSFNNYYIILEAEEGIINNIALNPWVIWLENYNEPELMDEASSEIVGGIWSASTPWNGPGTFANSLGWNGTNVTVSVADTGIGNGTPGNASHPDFEDRVINGTQYGSLTSWVDGHGHGTHVAGIIAGDGYEGTGATYPNSTIPTKYYVGLGVAPDAKLFAQRIFNSAGTYSGPSSWDTFFQDAFDNGTYVHSNSWGENPGDSAYETYDVEYDQAVRDSATSTTGDQPMVICVSAGNSGSGSGTIQSPSSGKNVISVGASESFHPDAEKYGETRGYSADNIDDIASFSSRGLEDDGRIKPDLMAPGTVVLSANSTSGSSVLHGIYSEDDRYLWCSGTSQSCPHVSGGAACVVEWWQANNNGSNPSPAMVKAALINTAQDMGAADIPNGNEGWGRMNLTALFDPPAKMDFKDQETLLQTGNTSNYDCYIASSDYPLKITLAWTDPAASSLANPTLINNLDLKVTAPDNTTIYYGNVFNSGMSTPGEEDNNSNWDVDEDGFDERNNVECIFIPSNNVQVGIYKIDIIADNVATDAVSNTTNVDQDFALVISGDLSEPNDVGVELIEAPTTQPKNEQAQIMAMIKNYGLNNQTTPFNVRCIIKDPTGVEVLNNTNTVSSLPVFTTTNKTWQFTPTIEGQYTILAQTELMSDDNNANNASIEYLMVPFILDDVASFTGINSNDRFGWNVSSAGDLNGDGYSDVIVGAPFNNSVDGSLTDAGAAYIYFGPKNGNYSVENADLKIYGTAANDHFGWDVADAGDVNGTYDDVIIGAPGNTSTEPGKVYIFYGWDIKNDGDGILLASDANVTITGGKNGDRFGCAVAGAGDINNADNDDVIIGAYLNDTMDGTRLNAGMAYLFFGNSNLTGNINVTIADVNLTGKSSGDYFGFSVSFAGDVNNDAYDDIIIGAPGTDKTYVYYGGKGIGIGGYSSILFEEGFESGDFTAGGWTLSSPAPVVSTDHPNTGNYAAGGSVGIFAYNLNTYSFQKKIDTSGYQNITIAYTVAVQDAGPGTISFVASYSTNGGTSWTNFETPITDNNNIYAIKNWDLSSIKVANNNPNFVIRFSGTFGGAAQSPSNCFWVDDVNVTGIAIPGTANANITINGENNGDNFGWSMNCGGNVNGDSYNDFVIGAPDYDNSSGRVYVFYGGTHWPSTIPASFANVTFSVGKAGDKFGFSVGSVDFEPDGYSNILIGAPYNDSLNGTKPDAGTVYVIRGSDFLAGLIRGANYARSGENAYDHLGWSVANALDMNDDNIEDIIVGAPHYDNGTISDAGKAYTFTAIIPEYSSIVIPITLMIFILAICRLKTIRRSWRKYQ